MSPLALLAAALAMFAAGGWAGIRWHAGQDAIAERARLEAIERDRRFAEKRVDTAATGYQGDRERLSSDFLIIHDRVSHALTTDFYAADAAGCLDAGGLRELTDAIAAPAPGGEPAPAVPGPAPAR